MPDINLDAEINKLSHKMFEDIEKIKKSDKSNKKKIANLCEKALGVLSQDGPYAYTIFIKSKNAEEYYLNKIFESKVIQNIFDDIKGKEYKKEIENLSKNLNQYLYFKEILEKILIYLRYHLKTLDDKQNKND